MRNKLGLLFALCCAMGIHSGAAATVVEASIDADHLYVPYGFDNNDHAEVVVSGWLPSSCYRRPNAKVIRRGATIELVLSASVNRLGNWHADDCSVHADRIDWAGDHRRA